MKLENIAHYLVLICFCLSGCNIVGHLDEISTLQGYSKEKDEQNKFVKAVNAHYNLLTKTIAEGHIGDYKDKASFVHAFGEPILKKVLADGSQRWLYRYAIFRLAKDKVYVYFDRHDMVIKWEKLPCSSFS